MHNRNIIDEINHIIQALSSYHPDEEQDSTQEEILPLMFAFNLKYPGVITQFIHEITQCRDDQFTLLHVAAQRGNLGVATYLMQNIADIDAQDGRGNTPLHYAILMRRYHVAESLIRRDARFLYNNNSETPASLLLTNLDLEVLNSNDASKIINLIKSIIYYDKKTSSPLNDDHFLENNHAFCDLLSVQTPQMIFAFLLEYCRYNGINVIEEYLVNHSNSINSNAFIALALHVEDINFIKSILEVRKIDLAQVLVPHVSAATSIDSASASASASATATATAASAASAATTATAATAASSNTEVKVVLDSKLIRARAFFETILDSISQHIIRKINKIMTGNVSATAVNIAIRQGNIDLTKLLLPYDYYINKTKDVPELNIIQAAITLNQMSIFDYFIKQYPGLYNRYNDPTKSPLFLAAKYGRTFVLDYFKYNGLICRFDYENMNMIHYTITHNHLHVFTQLVRYDITQLRNCDNNGNDAFSVICKNDLIKFFEVLAIDHTQYVRDNHLKSALQSAYENRNFSQIFFLINKFINNDLDRGLAILPLIHLSVKNDDLDFIKFISDNRMRYLFGIKSRILNDNNTDYNALDLTAKFGNIRIFDFMTSAMISYLEDPENILSLIKNSLSNHHYEFLNHIFNKYSVSTSGISTSEMFAHKLEYAYELDSTCTNKGRFQFVVKTISASDYINYTSEVTSFMRLTKTSEFFKADIEQKIEGALDHLYTYKAIDNSENEIALWLNELTNLVLAKHIYYPENSSGDISYLLDLLQDNHTAAEVLINIIDNKHVDLSDTARENACIELVSMCLSGKLDKIDKYITLDPIYYYDAISASDTLIISKSEAEKIRGKARAMFILPYLAKFPHKALHEWKLRCITMLCGNSSLTVDNSVYLEQLILLMQVFNTAEYTTNPTNINNAHAIWHLIQNLFNNMTIVNEISRESLTLIQSFNSKYVSYNLDTVLIVWKIIQGCLRELITLNPRYSMPLLDSITVSAHGLFAATTDNRTSAAAALASPAEMTIVSHTQVKAATASVIDASDSTTVRAPLTEEAATTSDEVISQPGSTSPTAIKRN